MISADFNFSRAVAGLDKLTRAAEAATRPAAQAGAQIFYKEVLARVPVSKGAHYFYGTHDKYLFRAGTLRDSIYQVFSKDQSGKSNAMYHVAWNHRKAPYGFMVEFGTSNAPAHPFLRPAYDSARSIAIAAVKARMQLEVSKAIQ